jgi:hypothetical protein
VGARLSLIARRPAVIGPLTIGGLGSLVETGAGAAGAHEAA